MRRFRWVALCLAILMSAGLAAGLARAQSAEEWLRRGDRAAAEDEKISAYAEAIRIIQPILGAAHFSKGIALFQKGRLDEAMADFTVSIQLRPKVGEGYYVRGLAYLAKDAVDQAIDDLTRAIELKPDMADAHYHLAQAHSRKGLLEQAIAGFSKAISLNVSHAEAFYGRGESRYRKNLVDEAIADFTMTIRLKPRHVKALRSRAIAYWSRNLLDLAVADYSSLLELKPDDKDTYYSRIQIHEHLKRYDLVGADHEKLVQLYPEKAQTHNGLAWFLATCPGPATCRNAQRAVEHALKALSLEPGYFHMDTLAAAYAEAGRFDEAVKMQEEAVQLLRKSKDAAKYLFEFQKRLKLFGEKKPHREE
ncbi:MAG: tetratricopeptide repeat protein [Nitrospinota bacterium]